MDSRLGDANLNPPVSPCDVNVKFRFFFFFLFFFWGGGGGGEGCGMKVEGCR